MIYLFSDFGGNGPYVGQLSAVLADAAPGETVVDLMHDAPMFDHRAAAYLLAALVQHLPSGGVVLGVVDPGVGRTDRRAIVMRAAGRWYVGPDNGLFAVVAKQTGDAEWWEITWRPEYLSRTFHGRDLFAPVAGMLARGDDVPGEPFDVESAVGMDWPNDLGEIVYIDHYGNAMTGIRAFTLPKDAVLKIADVSVARAHIFSDVQPGTVMWYENSCGLVEVAVNKANAAEVMKLYVGGHVLALAPD
jgi:S-adenosyl-L-methionine hydrolase (adenosine-forming)